MVASDILQVFHCEGTSVLFFDQAWPSRCPVCKQRWPTQPFESFDAVLATAERQQKSGAEPAVLDQDVHPAQTGPELSQGVKRDTTASSVAPGGNGLVSGSVEWHGMTVQRIASPLVSATQSQRSLLVRPTAGNMLWSFTAGSGPLHVGIASSDGSIVFNFDERGCMRDDIGWSECIAVQLPQLAHLSNEEWDARLESHCLEWMASMEPQQTGYHVTDRNCFDFVLAWLSALGVDGFTKSDFAESFVRHRLATAAVYVKLARGIHANGFVLL
ncbi:hypothetical protein CAOG_08258 [Capsaspora owczarzaki ATCC 30864]|uniref:MKRN2 opposite strand protein-like C-terminal domain-containing protein n=1 Tax=Capsaspora owczarzaki (strain ATCC 30864) TaxID=595528 RepID=A0A0D2X5R5_CAPO3|nr:hypothetical protein CAOG_08258 [Capsaspora owczarzaki ATCC 30864]KJE98269.1 hypothetical protein CAOG_008258 [Capsaspora owczarzaki ATCC 30864]|eukprot:XP_004342427.1 hypothetical protein CAOG_08258 [Capsaspora owczarzaki ATCC 30864]